MAVPKRRQSKTRTSKRRTHDALKPQTLTKCKECGAAIVPHRVCSHCGFYRGRRVLTIKIKEKKKEG